MFNFDTTQCYTTSNEHALKLDTPCLLRLGVQYSEKQSFLEAITKIYNIIHYTTYSLKRMKNHICDLIDIDFFVTLQNGNLVQVFKSSSSVKIPNIVYPRKVKKIKIEVDDSQLTLRDEILVSEKGHQLKYDLILKYKDSKIYEKIGKSNIYFLLTVINAFENFKKFLKSDSEYIDYTYLWDVVCSPESKLFSKDFQKIQQINDVVKYITSKSDGVANLNDVGKKLQIQMSRINDIYKELKTNDMIDEIKQGSGDVVWKGGDTFEINHQQIKTEGVNLIILDITNHDLTNRVEVLCPSNSYSKHLHNNSKSIIFIKQTNINEKTNYYYDIFEPILALQKKDVEGYAARRMIYEPFFENVPVEVKNVIDKIKLNLYDKCDPFKMPSIPGKFQFKENMILSKLREKLKTIQKEILCYVLSFDFKCIGLKIKTNSDNIGFIPCYPSAVNLDDDINMVFIDNPKIWSSYKNTIEFLNEVKSHNKEIPCSPMYFLEENSKLVGLFTETNQFIQFNPPIDNNVSDIFTVNIDSNSRIMHNPIQVDEALFKSNIKQEKVSYVHKLKCEQNFLNAFRLLCREKLSSLHNMRLHAKLKLILSNDKTDYEIKKKKLSILLKRLTENDVTFHDYTEEEISKISNVSLCNTNVPKVYCDKNKLKIPRMSLVTNDDNTRTYLHKIADDLLRYKTTRDFILDPKHLYFFASESATLNNDEILLYDSDITNIQFDKLKAHHESKFTLNNPTENIVSKNSKQYSNESNVLM